ncbi:MAG: lysozyme [Sutterella wadsworthensis]|nr:lysozyme [Sutterella wadsworthensis]
MKTFGEYAPECAMDFIEAWEGCKLVAYKCPAGIWTIGVGHTQDVTEHDEITHEQARELLRQDIEEVKRELAPFVNVHVTEGQYVALVSLAFNVGASYVVHNCPRLMRALNAGDVEQAAHQFLDITKAGGKELPGLVRRRKSEAKLFLGED